MESDQTAENIAPDQLEDDRVRMHTAPHVNAKIDALTELTLTRTVSAGRDAIVRRLKELGLEWDVDRALIANFAIFGSAALYLGRRVSPIWLGLLGAQLGFLMMHAAVGWCPPLPLFRRLGFRTAKEISAERDALAEQLDALTESGEGRWRT